MTQVPKSPRNSAVEMLRILAMLTIIYSHICYHSGFERIYSLLSINRLFVQFGLIGNAGVVLYMLISGYFLCESTFRTRSLSRLLTQVWFYSWTLFLVCRFVFGYTYTTQMLPEVFFPTLFHEYWFFTVYIVVFLMSPFINVMLRALTREQLRTMILMMTAFWFLVPTLTERNMYGTELPQFLLFYLIGAYLRKYPDNTFRKKAVRWAAVLVPLALWVVLSVGLGYMERYTPEAFGASLRYYDRNSLLTLSAALGLFTLAVYGKPFHSRFVNTLSGCTFGVYLIHDNPAVRELLWKNWLHWGDYFTSGSFIPRLILSILLVYTVCTAIEWLRQKTVAQPMEKAVERILSRLLKNSSLV